MTSLLNLARATNLPRFATVAVAAAALSLVGCDDSGGNPARQIGAHPYLPEVQQYLLPPIRIARPVPWGDETPKVAEGLQIRALATGFEHPRSLYVLPNGDVLVVESNGPKAPVFRPKDLITGWVQWFAGAKAEDANRITLLRDTNGDGIPDVRTVFLDHLNSPFGVALVGHDLYVANTDAIVRYPYEDGQTSITASGTKLTDLPGGPIDHHWTKTLLASPDGAKLYVGVGSNSNITENGIQAEYERAAIWEIDRASGAHRIFASGVRNPTGLQWEPETGKLWAIANERDEIGPDLVPDYLDLGAGWRLLWLALQLSWPASRSARRATTPRSRGQGDRVGLCPEFSCGSAWPRHVHRQQPSSAISWRRVRRRAW